MQMEVGIGKIEKRGWGEEIVVTPPTTSMSPLNKIFNMILSSSKLEEKI